MPGAGKSGRAPDDGVSAPVVTEMCSRTGPIDGLLHFLKALRFCAGIVLFSLFFGPVFVRCGLSIHEPLRFSPSRAAISLLLPFAPPSGSAPLRSFPTPIATAGSRCGPALFLHVALSSPVSWELEAEERYRLGASFQDTQESLGEPCPQRTRGAAGPGLAAIPGRQSNGAPGIAQRLLFAPLMMTGTTTALCRAARNRLPDALDYFSIRQGYLGRWANTKTPSFDSGYSSRPPLPIVCSHHSSHGPLAHTSLEICAAGVEPGGATTHTAVFTPEALAARKQGAINVVFRSRGRQPRRLKGESASC